MRKSLIIAAFIFGFATPALASQCPKDIEAIKTALETATLSSEDKANVDRWLMKAQVDHDAGNHVTAVEKTTKAKKVLGLQ